MTNIQKKENNLRKNKKFGIRKGTIIITENNLKKVQSLVFFSLSFWLAVIVMDMTYLPDRKGTKLPVSYTVM